MNKNIFNKILGNNLPLKEKLFRISLVVGAIVALVLSFERMIVHASVYSSFLIVLLFLSVLFVLVITFKFKHAKIGIVFFGFVLNCIVLPLTYLCCGGLESGSSIWMVIGIAYIFVFFEGKAFWLFLGISIVLDTTSILIGRFIPNSIIPFGYERDAYIDVLATFIIVGCALGAILKFQGKVYEQERKITLKQQEELHKLNEEKMGFFSRLSNQMRVPILQMLEMNQLILRENVSKEAVSLISEINNSGKILLSYVDDIMDCARLEAHILELDSAVYDTEAMLTEVVNQAGNHAKTKNIEFVVRVDNNLPKQLIGDEKRVKQVLTGMLINSINFTQEGKVSFEVRGEKIGGEWIQLYFQITDTGNGIKKEELDFIFEPYRTTDNQQLGSNNDLGIGLTICKQLVECMGGKIHVDSIYTKGTVYTFSFEQQIHNADEIGYLNTIGRSKELLNSIYRHSFEAPEACILIVDNNEMNHMILKKYLRYTKVQIDTATSGAECLRYTYNKFYNVIIVNYMMPLMNGVETLHQIRNQENGMCRETPVITLVSDNVNGGEKIYQEVGFSGYIQKPITGAALEALILQFLPDEIVEYRREVSAKDGGLTKSSVKAKRKILITTDSVCDISEEYAHSIGVKIFYLYIKTSRGRFLDYKELTTENLTIFGDESLYDTTLDSASPEEYEEFFAENLVDADEIIHISLGEQAGKSYHNAMTAAKGFDRVHIVDSTQISSGEALLVIYASKLAKLGKSVPEIIEALEDMRGKVCAGYVTKSVENLYRKGYAKESTRRFFSLLNLRPVIRLPYGAPKVSGFFVGDVESAYKKYIRREFRFTKNIDDSIIYISYAGISTKMLNELIQEIKRYVHFDKIVVNIAAASNTCGAGLGTFGFAYFEK